MAEEVEKLVGKWITRGLVIIPDYLRPRPQGRRIKYHAATRPIRARKGMAGVLAMVELVGNVSRDDMVIVLLSGGASALMPMPAEGMSLQDEAKVTALLLKSCSNIEEINTVRKHLSQVKGGRLAMRLYPATVLSLIISDVVGDRIDAIASGPTAPDPTTYYDAKQIHQKYHLCPHIPDRARKVITNGLAGSIPDTPKRRDKAFRQVRNLIVGNNRESCLAATEAMTKPGYRTQTLSIQFTGEAREAGRTFGAIARDILYNPLPFAPPPA